MNHRRKKTRKQGSGQRDNAKNRRPARDRRKEEPKRG